MPDPSPNPQITGTKEEAATLNLAEMDADDQNKLSKNDKSIFRHWFQMSFSLVVVSGWKGGRGVLFLPLSILLESLTSLFTLQKLIK